ncbi:MAG: hypothetical protein Q9166_003922 [cf. Caloplaca sp. 2 TL-2023]
MKGANEAKAARRAEIERRCSLFDPPLLPNILNHMESFQAAIQISTPLTDFAWDVLKPRLLAQRANAEKREQELVQQNELLQSEHRQRRHQETQFKDSKETIDRHWDSTQAPIRDRLSALADAVIDERWYGGTAVTKETSPRFAADVLLCVRKQFYDEVAQSDRDAINLIQPGQNGSPNRPTTQKLILENMKWVFDTKIKPFTENFQKELFLCNGCDDNFKFYGFEGVIQHYAAKHTTSLSQGSIVVYWRAEWPDEPPFNPEPSLSKSAYYKVPSPASAGGNLYSQIDQQLFNPDDRYGAPTEPEPQQATDGQYAVQTTTAYHSTQAAPYLDTSHSYPYSTTYPPVSLSAASPNGVSNGFAQPPLSNHLQQWSGNSTLTAPAQVGVGQNLGPQYTGCDYLGSFNPQETACSASYGSQATFRATAPHPPHFDPSRNNVAQLTEGYQQQMDEMAKQARDIWFSTSGIKDLPASIRIYVVIQHIASRCSAKFSTVPSLAMFLDGLDNNAQMRPVRSLNGLACKICVTQNNTSYYSNPQSQPPAGDRKLFTLPHLLNHFRNAHLEGSEAFANPNSGPGAPKHDWTRDMIELPETRLIANLVYSPGMDDNKLDLISWAFPNVFPSPLPSLGVLRSSGLLRSTGPVPEFREVPSLRTDYPTGPVDHGQITMPGASKNRTDEPAYDRPLSHFRPVSRLSRPSEPPGDDEYDPHKPAYQSKPHMTGASVEGRSDVFSHSPDQPREKYGRQERYYGRKVPETTDLSELIYSATQLQPDYEERKRPDHKIDSAYQLQPTAFSPRSYNHRPPAADESIIMHGLSYDKVSGNDANHSIGQSTDSYASKQPEVTIPRNHSPIVSAGLQAAEQFLQRFSQTSELGDNPGPSSLEQRQRPSPVNQWPGETGVRVAESERRYQTSPSNAMSYRTGQMPQNISPRNETYASRPISRVERDTSPTQFHASGMYQHANHRRAASNALVSMDDPEVNGTGNRAYVEYATRHRAMVHDHRSWNGYGGQRPESTVDDYQPTQETQHRDRPRSSAPVAADTVYYRSRSPAEDPQAQPVYHVRSPRLRKQVQRISYGHPSQDRYEVFHESGYAHNPQVRYQQRVEYVPIRVGDQRAAESSRYLVAQPVDQGGRAEYVRLEDAYGQGTVYEHDGQLYRTDPRTYRTSVARGSVDVAPSYSY